MTGYQAREVKQHSLQLTRFSLQLQTVADFAARLIGESLVDLRPAVLQLSSDLYFDWVSLSHDDHVHGTVPG